MAVTAESVMWNDRTPPSELLATAVSHDASLLLIEPEAGWTSPSVIQVAHRPNPASLIVASNSESPARSVRHDSELPPQVKLLAYLPDHDSAAAIPVKVLETKREVIRQCRSLCELVLRIAETTPVVFEDNLRSHPAHSPLPPLTTPAGGPRNSWLRGIIREVKAPGATAAQLSALHAGLYLLNDFFDESHSCSQSIEGVSPHTGDYWHAILHRREPDYGNSKYWFRHVGRHSAFPEVARRVDALRSHSDGTWDQLLPRGDWDPLAFVDLCAKAEHDSGLTDICEQIQFHEMLALLEATWHDAALHESR